MRKKKIVNNYWVDHCFSDTNISSLSNSLEKIAKNSDLIFVDDSLIPSFNAQTYGDLFSGYSRDDRVGKFIPFINYLNRFFKNFKVCML